MRRPLMELLGFVAAMLLCWMHAPAQAELGGTVVDPSGAAVVGCPVRLESPDGVVLRVVETDERGVYRLGDLPAGEYVLVVAPVVDFAAARLPLRHGSGAAAATDVHLKLLEVTQKVDVAEDAAAVAQDPGANSDQVTASGKMIEKVPILNQDVIATFTPFLSQNGVGTRGVTLVVDGIEMKSTGVSASAIKSVSINADPYSAESNRPGRGRIEITTKAGTPKFHGTFNFTFRDGALDATTHFALARPAEQRRMYEGNLTGPLARRGKTTFLLSGTRQEDDLQAIVHASGLNGFIDANVDTPVHTTVFAMRAARELSTRHRVSAQYNVEDVVARNQGAGGIVLGASGVNSQTREDDLIYNDSFTFTPSVLNQFQFFLEKDHNPVRSATDAQRVVVDGAFVSGGAQANVLDTENTLKINDIVSVSRGRHFLKTGIVIPNLSRRAWEDHANRLGTFKYASLADYAAGNPYAYTQETGPGRAVFWANELGIFVQDQVQVRPALQIAIGLRYDWQSYFDSPHNFAPRFSAAWAPGRERKTVARAGAGLFYDRTGVRPISEIKRFNGVVIRSITVLNPNQAQPVPGNIASLPTDLVTPAPGAIIPVLGYSSFGIDRQLAKGTTLAVTYRGNLGWNLFRSADVNAPAPPGYSVRPNGTLGAVRQIQTRGRQVSNAFDITFKGNAGRWFNGLAQYTLSHTVNDTGGIAWFPQNQYDDTGEYARANFDQRHRFNVLGTINEGHWLSLGVAGNLYSGTPYTETAGVDILHTSLLNERPAGVGRNTLTTGGYANLDLRWSHDFPLTRGKERSRVATIAFDAFNILNRTNYSGYVGNARSPFFAQPTSALPARRLQVTARFTF